MGVGVAFFKADRAGDGIYNGLISFAAIVLGLGIAISMAFFVVGVSELHDYKRNSSAVTRPDYSLYLLGVGFGCAAIFGCASCCFIPRDDEENVIHIQPYPKVEMPYG